MSKQHPTEPPPYFLVVRVGPTGQAFWEVSWRHRRADGTTRPVKRRLGPAHVELAADGSWQRPRSRPRPLRSGDTPIDDRAAAVAAPELVRRVDEQLREDARDDSGRRDRPVTFREVAADFMVDLADVRDGKPSTLRTYRSLLAEPGTPHRRGKGTSPGHIMAALGDLPAAEVTTRDVNRMLRAVAATGVVPRTVNIHRQLVRAIFAYGMKPATYALPSNPAADSDRRQEPAPKVLDFYSPEEIEAIARAFAAGAHRRSGTNDVSAAEREWRELDDRQDGEIVRVAGYSGLRRGELVALRWRDVDFPGRKILVQRAVSADQEMDSTKGRRVREVPLTTQAAAALDRVSRRRDFTSPDDYVFCGRFGTRLDGTALSARYLRAREAAGLRRITFHGLRHTYGSLLVAAGVDLASVQAALGHQSISTTMRYLHARPAVELADRFSAAFEPKTPPAISPTTSAA